MSTKPKITAFKDSPDEGRGLARDMRVRWAFEEVGVAYDVRLVTFDEMEQPEYLALHPFGLIPTFEDEEGLVLFESGAIVLHLASPHPGLLPTDARARARAITWMFAALSTVEPPIVELEYAMLVEQEESWYQARLPILKDRIREVLGDLSQRLGDSNWLEGDAFTAGDLMMVMVLRRVEDTGLLEEHENLMAYVNRGVARPAYQRAYADQAAVFKP